VLRRIENLKCAAYNIQQRSLVNFFPLSLSSFYNQVYTLQTHTLVKFQIEEEKVFFYLFAVDENGQ
jgi:hypothetical protein